MTTTSKEKQNVKIFKDDVKFQPIPMAPATKRILEQFNKAASKLRNS
jgi:hypothetical protein